jgi:hypothetical protein
MQIKSFDDFMELPRANPRDLIEVVSKPPLGLNLCVGPRRSILEIFPIFLRLTASVRLDLKPD